MSRKVSIVAVLVVVGMSLTGCQLFGNFGQAPVEPVRATADDFYAQTVSWSGCGDYDGMQCAKIAAPTDWDAPADGEIELAIVKSPATGTAQGSVLVNPGGPGGSGWSFVYGQGPSTVSAAVSESFDIIGWDPRGVGQSTPVTCYSEPAETDEVLYGTFEAEYDSQAWIDELTQVEQAFAAACGANTGALLGNLDAASNAKDMDMIRALVGDDKLNYLGYSYGTFFGTVYAELFPQNVGRLVLDGAIDPLLSSVESLTVQMAGFDSAFRAYMEYCLGAAGSCPFSGSVDEALGQARTVLEGVDARGLVGDDGRELDSATLGTAIALNLYSESYWPDMSMMFEQLEADDPALVFENADYYNSRNPDGSYDGNSFEVYTAASCADGDFTEDSASTLDRVAEIDAAAPILGKFFAYDDYAVLDVACTNWPVAPGDLPASFSAVGAAPILVIGTTNDPATPYAWAQSLASQLSSGVMISYTGEGHTIYNQGVACIDDLVGEYFVNGTVPSVDPMC